MCSVKKSIIENDPTVCYVCGSRQGLERHHVFGGSSDRAWSEEYGLTVHLCYRHHRDPRDGVHFDAALADQLHQEGQRAFERHYPGKKFSDIFRRNYLDGSAEEPPRNIPISEGIIWLDEE